MSKLPAFVWLAEEQALLKLTLCQNVFRIQRKSGGGRPHSWGAMCRGYPRSQVQSSSPPCLVLLWLQIHSLLKSVRANSASILPLSLLPQRGRVSSSKATRFNNNNKNNTRMNLDSVATNLKSSFLVGKIRAVRTTDKKNMFHI